jgi:hypothetical protein
MDAGRREERNVHKPVQAREKGAVHWSCVGRREIYERVLELSVSVAGKLPEGRRRKELRASEKDGMIRTARIRGSQQSRKKRKSEASRFITRWHCT